MRDFVARNRYHAHAPQRDHGESDGVVSGKHQKCFRHSVDGLGDLRHIAAGFLYADNVRNLREARQCCGLKVRSGACGYVVENQRLLADGLGDRLEVPVLTFLRGLVVVRRSGENGVNTGARRDFFRFFNRLVRGVGSCTSNDRHASGDDFNRSVDYKQPLVMGKSGGLASGAARNQKINAGFHLPRHQVAKSGIVDRAILVKRSYQCGATTTELHTNKITRMRVERNRPGGLISSTALPALLTCCVLCGSGPIGPRLFEWVTQASDEFVQLGFERAEFVLPGLDSCSAWISVVMAL